MNKAIIVIDERGGLKYGRVEKPSGVAKEVTVCTSDNRAQFYALEDVEIMTAVNQMRARREAMDRQEARRAAAARKAAGWRLGLKLASAAVCLICVALGLCMVARGGCVWMGVLGFASGALALVLGGW